MVCALLGLSSPYLLFSVITSVEYLVAWCIGAFCPSAANLGRLRPHELREMADIDELHQIFPVVTKELDLIVPVVYHHCPVRLHRSQVLSCKELHTHFTMRKTGITGLNQQSAMSQ